MKKIVFIHVNLIPEDTFFEDLTDKQVYYLQKTNKNGIIVYDTIDDFLSAFNNEAAPSDDSWYGRIIDFSLYE